MLWKIAVVALVLALAAPARADPLSDLHALAASAPRLADIDHMDRLIDQAHAHAAHVPSPHAAAPALDTAFLGSESVVSHLGGQDSELQQLGALSSELTQKKHAVELQRSAIDADEGKLQRLRRIIAENKEILVRNEQALAASSSQYLGAVQKYTTKVNAAVVESLQATQDAARAQVDSITGASAKKEEEMQAQTLDAADEHAAQLVGGESESESAAGRSFVSVDASADASAEVHAAQMAEARLSAEHAEQFARLVAMKAKAINQEYIRDLAAHKASIPKTHQNDFAAFTANLNLDQAAEMKRADALRAAMHVEHKPEPLAAKPTPIVPTQHAFDVGQVAKVRAEMAGEPVTMFLELDASMYVDAPEPVPGTEVSTVGLVKPKIEDGVIGLPEPLPTPKPDLSKLPACPPDAPNKPDAPAAVPATPTNTGADGPYVAPVLIEESAEGENENENENEMEAETDVDVDAEADADADAEEDAFVEEEAAELDY